MVTIKQLADELKISKVAVSNRIDSLGLRSQLVKVGNKYTVPADVADQVRESFRTNRKTASTDNKPNADVIEILSEQLKAKDEQIASLMKQLEQLQSQNGQLLQAVQQGNYLLANTLGVTEQDPADEPIYATEAENTERSNVKENLNTGILKKIFGKILK